MSDVAIKSRREKLRSVIGTKIDVELMDNTNPYKNATLLDVGQHSIFVTVAEHIERVEFSKIRTLTYHKEETIRGPFGEEGQN